VRTLNNIFKRRREIERIEALGKVFKDSHAEDIAKVFEFGRIEALSTLKKQLYTALGAIALVITILGFILSHHT
jgi:hypothetical protein